ncbi:sirtuin 7 [Aphomia sociella]
MEARGGLRCSARLNGEATRTSASAGSDAGGVAGDKKAAAAAAAAAAALRRARAAERAREVEDSPRVLRDKCRRLARALRNAKHLVVYTGAGISTAADIPDYRGPHGVWTRLQRGETVGRVEVSRARPTFTHMALTALWARGTLKFVASQNCDGLHVRAGLPRRALAELHGDMFAELCGACRRVYVRAFDTTERTARHAHGTRRLCHACATELRDSIVHFGERGRAAWPLNWAGALRHAARADVVLCLGSSLKVLRRYPRLWRMHRAPRARPALYIVNLQWTPKDSAAALKINARCDAVMRQVARRLRLRVPRYRASRDPLLAHAEPLAAAEAHTTRRPLLRAADLSPPSSSTASPSSASPSSASPSSASSSSASDSDEELPLRRLAERLRARPPPPSPPPPPPDLLHAFQVNMRSGEATILLRAEHAPSVPSSPASSPGAPVRRPVSLLRQFRISRRPADDATGRVHLRFDNVTNGHSPDAASVGRERGTASPLVIEPKKEEDEGGGDLGSRLRRLLRSPGGASAPDAAGALAAAIIARAVLVCRASLYPGLHTIIAPPAAPPPPRAACAWCWARFASPRCLWYGPPRAAPPERRAWRRVRGRRYLCACCGGGGGDGGSPPRAPAAAAAAAADGPLDDGGWYGKGYRKGRRRRR